MKTIYHNPDTYKLVDNQQDYDFVGWMENFTDKTLIVIFSPGSNTYDEEADEDYWNENEWTVEEIALCDDAQLEEKKQFVEINRSYPTFTTMIEIEPHKWGGFAADNEGRSMFNALQKHFEK